MAALTPIRVKSASRTNKTGSGRSASPSGPVKDAAAGRAGRTGRAILFITPREMHMLKVIERATRQKIEPLAMPTPREVAHKRVAQFTQQILDTLKNEKLEFFFDVIRNMETDHNIGAREIAAALTWISQRERPLQLTGASAVDLAPPPARNDRNSSERSERSFDRGNDRPSDRNSDRPPRENREQILENRRTFAAGDLARYRIEVGRNQGVLPKEIVGAIANEGGIDGKQIGQINLFDDFSTVELPANLPADVMDVLRRIRVRQFALKARITEPGEYPDTRPPRPAGPPRAKKEWGGKSDFRGSDKKPEWKKRDR